MFYQYYPTKYGCINNDIDKSKDRKKMPELSWDELFSSYYSKLNLIESRHRDLLKARDDLQWSNPKSLEAARIGIEIDLLNLSDLPIIDLVPSNTFKREHLELSLSNARKKVDDFKNTSIQFKSNLEIFEKESQSKISSLKGNLQNIEKDIEDTIDKIKKLKTQKMVEILIIIGSGIFMALLFPNGIAVMATMLFIWFLRSQ